VALAYLPYTQFVQHYLIGLEDDQRLFASFVVSGGGVAAFFKCLITAFSTYPKGVDRDLSTWLLYFTSNPEPRFGPDGKLMAAAPGELRSRIIHLLMKIAAGSVLYAVLQPPQQEEGLTKYYETNAMFETPPSLFGNSPAAAWLLSPLESSQTSPTGDPDFLTELGSSVTGLLSRSLHTYLWVWAMYLLLSTSLDVGALPTLLRGVSIEPGFANPMGASRSAKELWGARWNRPINFFLKRGVFKPTAFGVGGRGGFGPLAGTAAAFVASGLFHEYIFSLQFGGCYGVGQSSNKSSGDHAKNSEGRCSELPSFFNPGFATVFFIIQGSIMTAEQLLAARLRRRDNGNKKTELFDGILPAPLVSALHIALSAVAFENLFLFSWVASGFFHAAASLFPVLVLAGCEEPGN
jgi:hypothetical protein